MGSFVPLHILIKKFRNHKNLTTPTRHQENETSSKIYAD